MTKINKLLSILMLFLSSLCAAGSDLELMWNIPTNNTDGTTLNDLAGIKIYIRDMKSNQWARIIDVGITNSCSVTGLLNNAIYYITATAYNTNQIESEHSRILVIWRNSNEPIRVNMFAPQ